MNPMLDDLPALQASAIGGFSEQQETSIFNVTYMIWSAYFVRCSKRWVTKVFVSGEESSTSGTLPHATITRFGRPSPIGQSPAIPGGFTALLVFLHHHELDRRPQA